ncbi:MAG: nitrilase-related carbon-nitrogen hydrolase [Solirubrobacterales bacterium]
MRLAIAAALASGVLLWLAAPAVGAGWLAWIALVPAASVVLAFPGTRAARLSIPLGYVVYLELLLVPAFPFGVADGQFGDPVVPVLVGGSPVLAIALVVVPLVGALLYAVRFGQPWGAGALPAGAAAVAAIAVPALAWTALDFARAKLDPGALWGPLFLSQTDQSAGSVAALGGPWLITLAIVAVNYGIAAAIVRRRIAPALASAVVAVALILAGSAAEPQAGDARALRVAAIQPGYDTANEERQVLRRFEPGTWDLAALDLIRDDLGDLTRSAARRGAELVVWPEASMYVDPRREPPVRRALLGLSRSTGVTLIVPFFDRPANEGYAIAVVPSAGGARLTEARAKQRPAWVVGESRGEGEALPIDLDGIRVGTLLGTDPQDARIAGVLASEGAELLASSTHDWRQSAAPQAAYARLAARASGLTLIRADWRYGSAIYAPDGERLAYAGHEQRRTTLVADVGIAAASTPYAAVGDLVGWLAAGASLAALVATARAGRRRPISPRDPAIERSGGL